MIILRNIEILGRSGAHDVAVDKNELCEVGPTGTVGMYEHADISFNNAIAFPGLINSHDHLEFDVYEALDGGPYRDYIEWADKVRRRHASRIAELESLPRELRIRAGIAKNLLCGVTTVAHHGSDAQYTGAAITVLTGSRSIHSPRLEGVRGLLVPDRRPVVAHVGEGIGNQSEKEIDAFTTWNIWRKKLIGVHAIAMRPHQAVRFVAIVWCPVSNEFLYGRTAPVSELKLHTTVLFGTDSTISSTWNIWSHIRRARELRHLTDEELISALTTNAAQVWNLGNCGRLQPGAAADIVVAQKRCNDPTEAFFAVNPEDILLVIKNGKIVGCDASMCSQLPFELPYRIVVNGREKYTAEDYGLGPLGERICFVQAQSMVH